MLALAQRLLGIRGGDLLQTLHGVLRCLDIAVLLLRLYCPFSISQLFLNQFELAFYIAFSCFMGDVFLFESEDGGAAVLFEVRDKVYFGEGCV